MGEVEVPGGLRQLANNIRATLSVGLKEDSGHSGKIVDELFATADESMTMPAERITIGENGSRGCGISEKTGGNLRSSRRGEKHNKIPTAWVHNRINHPHPIGKEMETVEIKLGGRIKRGASGQNGRITDSFFVLKYDVGLVLSGHEETL